MVPSLVVLTLVVVVYLFVGETRRWVATFVRIFTRGLRHAWTWLVRFVPSLGQSVPAFVRVIFHLIELVVGVGVVAVAGVAVWNFGTHTLWRFEGLLTAVDTHWKGPLLLVAVLFYRPVQELVARATTLKTPLGEFSLQPKQEPDERPLPDVQVPPPPARNG